MRNFATVFAFIALTFFCWGIYGPVLHEGQQLMGMSGQLSSLRPFICVGIAYFVIAVIVPVAVLRTIGEKGHWTMEGTVWSLAAGAVGALGALGIILAFKFRGNPVYVMPLVFGCAPIVNTFVTMWMAKNFGEAGPIFYAGIITVAIGAAGLMYFKPLPQNVTVETSDSGRITIIQTHNAPGRTDTTRWEADSEQQLASSPNLTDAYAVWRRLQPLTLLQMTMIPLSIALTAVCWGSYGPVLHKGQMKMQGSRLRPLLCVGLAYFAIAVVVPFLLLPALPEPGGFNQVLGTLWSLGAGTAGAIGALGIILAFNFGGKPIYVMPLVFGCAPVVNTFVTIIHEQTWAHVPAMFFAALLLVIIGAVTVLLFAPKAHPAPVAAK